MNGARGESFWWIVLLAAFSLAAFGAGPPMARPGGLTTGLLVLNPSDAGGNPPTPGRPESLSGSLVTFDGTGGAACYEPGVENTFCFRLESVSSDFEPISGLALKFPEGWIVSNVPGAPLSRSCNPNFACFQWQEWYIKGSDNQVMLDFYLGCFDYSPTSCSTTFCITVLPPPDATGDANVSWLVRGESYGYSPPNFPCSNDGYSPSNLITCDEAIYPPAVVPECPPPPLSLSAQPPAQDGCPGYSVSYDFTVTNTTPDPLALPVVHSGNAWPVSHPATITVPAYGTATFALTHSVPGGLPSGVPDPVSVTVTNPADPSQTATLGVTTTTSSGGWSSVADSAPPWSTELYASWPGCGCTALDAAGHWVTYTLRDPNSAYPALWGYDHDANAWFQPPEPAGPYPGPRLGYAAAYDPSTNLCYFAGGLWFDGTYNNWFTDAWAYDPLANAFTPLPDFTTGRTNHGAWLGTVGTSKYLCVGGGNDSTWNSVGSTQCYNLTLDAPAWDPENLTLGPLPTLWSSGAFATLNAPGGDQFWLSGGWVSSGLTDAAWYFDAANPGLGWQSAGSTGFPREYPSGGIYDGAYFQLGGWDYSSYPGQVTATVVRYAGAGWEPFDDMPHARGNPVVGSAPTFLAVVDGYQEILEAPMRAHRQEDVQPIGDPNWVDVLQDCPEGGCPAIAVAPAPPLASGEVGVPYTVAFAASGGTAPYTFFVAEGALPPGLVLSPAGILSGSPTVHGPTSFAVGVLDAAGCPAMQRYSLYICPRIYFDPNPWTLPNAILGQFYQFQLGGAGGTAPYTVTVIQNSLPPGLSIGGYCYPNRAVGGPEGMICGIPTAVGNYGFTLQVTDAMGCSTSRWFEIYVCSPISVGPASLPSGRVGTAYSKTFTANGGTAAYTFSLTSGALPAGLTLSPGGMLLGTPLAPGLYGFDVTATDQWGCQGTTYYELVICGTITLSPNSPLPGGQVGAGYSQIITATGAGAGTYTFAVSAGMLPPGITLDAGGLLSGTPLYGGTYSFTVRATFEGVCTGSKAYTVYICPVITVNPATLPAGKKGTLYSRVLTGAGGTGPYTFALAGGALPTGLTLAAGTGKLSGYPTAAGTYNFAVRARDSKGCTGTRNYTVVINP